MWQSTDYRDKYGPMLYLLNSEQDYEYLATKAGYREEIAHDYRDVQRRSLRAYLLDLEADINELREAAAPVALGNAEIARSVEHNLRMFSSVSRYVRFRLAFDRYSRSQTERSSGARAGTAGPGSENDDLPCPEA